MKKKYSRILGVTLTLMLVVSLFGFAATPVSAKIAEWGSIGNPSASELYMNLADADVGPIAVTPDGGTLFAAVVTEANITGVGEGTGDDWDDVDGDGVRDSFALVTSTDGGHYWSATGLINQPAAITGIAISDNFATDGTVYVASGATVFRSTDSGVTFIALKPLMDSSAAPITAINSIAMWPGTPAFVMVGTDCDVMVLRDAVFENWRDQELNADARAVAFAPDFNISNYIWAVTAAGVVTTTNSPGAWGTVLANTPALSAAVNACIVFPDDYSSITATYLWVGIDSGAANTGGVWRVRGLPLPGPSQAVKQYGVAPTPAAQWDVRSLDVSGTMAAATLIAGLQDAPTVIKSANGGITWPPQIFKQPTGTGVTYVVMAPDFATSNLAYVGTSDFGVMLEPEGSSTADWSTAQKFGGNYSVVLTCLGSTSLDWSAAKIPYGEPLATLVTYTKPAGSYTVLDVAFNVWATDDPVNYAMLWIDEDADGTVDTRLTGGFDVDAAGTAGSPPSVSKGTWVEAYKTSAAMWQLRDYDAGIVSTYSGTNASDVDSLPGYLADAGINAIVMYVGVGYTNNTDPAYVDDITINGVNYNLEPASSAFQVSRDGGITWNQTGLIDCGFSVITDIAVVDMNTVFMVSDGFSLWKTEDATNRLLSWERILTADTVTIPANPLAGGNINLVVTSPDFLTDGVVYTTDNADGIMKAIDGGSIFAPMGDPGGPGLAAITALHVVDATFAFTGAVGQFYRTDDGGYSWLPATVPPAGMVTSIALAPNYAESGHVLVGCTGSTNVFKSEDRGVTFARLPGPPPMILGGGAKYVAFDQTIYTGSGRPGFATIYAASATVIGRWKAPSPAWESIDGTMPTGVAVPAVAGDTFAILGSAAGPDSGVITLTTGTISVTTTGAATYVASTGAYTVPGAGDSVVVAATGTVAVTGSWSRTNANAIAAITVDATVGGNATVSFGPGSFSLPDGGTAATTGDSEINGLVTSPDGTIYASNALPGMGLERSLDPIIEFPPLYPTFERVATAPGYANATLEGLWLVVDETLDVSGSKNVLFSIDTTGTGRPPTTVDRILTYTDTLATEVVLTSPEDGTVFPRVTDVTLEWETLTGARGYHWQIARDDSFRLVQDEGFSTYATDMSDQLRAGEAYYWRVRVDGDPEGAPGLPLLSRWSATQTFTTELGGRIWHPFSNIAGVAPAPGAQDILTKPVFQWNGADWATSYELMLADNAAFTGATAKTLTTTSWVSDTDLGYSTTWYWKVRALSATSGSEWSDVGVFTTMAEPVEPIVIQDVPDIIVEQPDIVIPAAVEVTPVAPAYLLAIIIIGAALVIFVVVLIVRTRRPI